MTELIRITEHNGKQAISARELHAFLESKQQFTDWIKNRIDKYDLVENIDYQAFHNFMKCQNGIGGTTRIEYVLTIDAAKELSMVEGNEKGKQARRYFIECEKQLSASQIGKLSQAEIIFQMAQFNLQQEKRIATIESMTNELYQTKQLAEADLNRLPIAENELPECSLQNIIKQLVNSFAKSKSLQIRTVWDKVYQTLEFNHGVRIKACKKLNKSESWLDVAARKGHLEKIHTIISNFIKQSNQLTA